MSRLDALRSIVLEVQKDRVAPLPAQVAPAPAAEGLGPFEADDLDDAIGEALREGSREDRDGRPFRSLPAARFPVLLGIHRQFSRASSPSRILRVDDDASLAEFRELRALPRLAAVEERLARLEAAVAEHVADGHGGRLAVLEDAFARHVAEHTDQGTYLGDDEDLSAAQEALDAARVEDVPLSLEPSHRDAVDCWFDEDEVLCTLRALGSDGKIRAITSGTPVRRHAEATTRYARAAGIHPADLAPIFRPLVGVVAGSYLLPQVASATQAIFASPEILGGETPVVLRAQAVGDPGLAAAMEFLQCCERGDAAACEESRRLRKTAGGARLLAEAQDALSRARRGERR